MHSFVSPERVYFVVRHERVYFVLVLLFYVLLVLFLAASRDYLGYGTETDFLGGFVPEAKRFLSGEPLESAFHPPLYPIFLALIYVLMGDWMTAGLVISGLSGLVVLSTAYVFFLQLCGRPAAWGALLGLFGSHAFLGYSILATSDLFFLALFSTSCLLALRASSTGSLWLWAIGGAAIGLSMMTRTNGLTLLVLLLLPFTSSAGLRSNLRDAGAGALGVAAVIVCFVAYAVVTGSNLLPNSYIGLAMNYFTEEPRLGEGMQEAETRFDSLTEVLLHDPGAIIAAYAMDFYRLFSQNLVRVVEVPLVLLFPVGLLALIGRFSNTLFLVSLANVVAQVMLVNFKAFEPRYYLFLVPWIGASVGQVIWLLLQADWLPLRRRLVTGFLAVGIVLAVGLAIARTAHDAIGQGAELAEVVPRVQGKIPEGAKIVARKPHVAFYTGGTPLYIPDLETLADLRDYLGSVVTDKPVFLFYGAVERDLRPQFMVLSNSSTKPDWLVEVVRSERPGDWNLFRFTAPTLPANLHDER